MDANDPKYLYADILIGMAYADGHADDDQKDLVYGICKEMNLDEESVEKMWMTPRTPDVTLSMLGDIQDENFKRCLLKDCYLLAYADGKVVPEESKFIQEACEALNLDANVSEQIHAWSKAAVEQQRNALELFGRKL